MRLRSYDLLVGRVSEAPGSRVSAKGREIQLDDIQGVFHLSLAILGLASMVMREQQQGTRLEPLKTQVFCRYSSLN